MAKTVILIGNGFDLALGLETGYTQFVDSVHFKKITSSSLCRNIEKMRTIQNWVDLELEILAYAKELSRIFNPLDVPVFKKEYEELCQALTEYLKSNANNLRKIPDHIESLTNTWFNENVGRQRNDRPTVICFNYTPHCEDHFESWCDVKYVHGRILENKIVLGADDISYQDINPAFSFILKSGADDINIYNVGEIINNADKFIILGCSLGYSDHWYYNRIFNLKKKIFEIYYHGEDQKDAIVNNIRSYTSKLSDLKSNNILQLFDSSDLLKSRLRYNTATKIRSQMGIPAAQQF